MFCNYFGTLRTPYADISPFFKVKIIVTMPFYERNASKFLYTNSLRKSRKFMAYVDERSQSRFLSPVLIQEASSVLNNWREVAGF